MWNENNCQTGHQQQGRASVNFDGPAKMSTARCEISSKIPARDFKLLSASDIELPTMIAGEIVSEILETALDMAGKAPVGDIFNTKRDSSTTCDEPLEKSEEKPKKKGLGDQLEGKAELLTRPTPSKRYPPVEKKHRLTDLVRNSKQMLAKYILQESKTDVAVEKEEKLISVTEFECEAAGCSRSSPEKIPLPRNDSEEIIGVPDENSLDEISLPAPEKSDRDEELQKKTMTFPMASAASGRGSFVQRCRTLKLHTGDMKKKKWNLGSKLAQLLKKGQRKEKKAEMDGADEKETDEVGGNE